MSYVIARPCIGVKDAACTVICPTDCIHPTPSEPGFAASEQSYIDPSVCIDCGLCASECPVNAIFPEQDLPTEWADFMEKNAAHYR